MNPIEREPIRDPDLRAVAEALRRAARRARQRAVDTGTCMIVVRAGCLQRLDPESLQPVHAVSEPPTAS